MRLRDNIVSANTGLDAIKRAPILDYETGIKCIRIQDISQEKDYLNWGNTETTISDYKKFCLKKNDILIARTGATVGVSYYVKEDVKAVFNNGTIRLRFNSNIDPFYMYQIFKTKEFRTYVDNISCVATQPNLRIEGLLRFTIRDVDIKQQQKISKCLSLYNDLIENNTKRMKLLEKAAEELYKEWFVRFRFPGFENAEFDQGLPRGWTIESMSQNEYVRLLPSGIKSFSGTKTYLATANVDKGHVDGYDSIIDYNNRPSRANMQPTKNTVWFAKMKNSPKYLIMDDYHESLINNTILSTGFTGLEVSSDALYFFYGFVSSNDFDSLKNLYANGSTQEAINNARLQKIQLCIPTRNVMSEYGKIVKPFFQEIHSLEKKNDNLIRQRDSLLPRLMSGKLDVSDKEII